MAFLSYFFGGLLGFYHGVRIMEVEGLDVTRLGAMVGQVAGALGKIVQADAENLARNNLDAPESTLQNSATVMDLIRRHAREAGLDPRFPEFGSAWFREGLAAGFGKRDTASMVEVLRGV